MNLATITHTQDTGLVKISKAPATTLGAGDGKTGAAPVAMGVSTDQHFDGTYSWGALETADREGVTLPPSSLSGTDSFSPTGPNGPVNTNVRVGIAALPSSAPAASMDLTPYNREAKLAFTSFVDPSKGAEWAQINRGDHGEVSMVTGVPVGEQQAWIERGNTFRLQPQPWDVHLDFIGAGGS